MGKNKGSQGLGRTLIKSQGNAGQQHRVNSTFRHTTELNDGNDWARLNLHSITEQTNIDEFLATAELAGVEFTAEKENIKFVSSKTIAYLPTEQEISVIKDAQIKFKSHLSIPRRPKWDESTTGEQLQEKERESFLSWRKELNTLQEQEGILMTPYEKNLEFWRQLWRVVERSDIVVQIVDARNPLLFWCEDLETYVKEVNSNKINMVLLNKADFLTASQRQAWARYFEERGMVALFFSALSHLEEEQPGPTKKESVSENDSESEQNDVAKLDELNPAEAVSQGKIFTREELEEFWLALPTGEKVKEDITTVGLVGYPNVGKSSTINALLQFKKVSVSATPGKTKHFQTLMLSDELCLCDCPGLVFPSFVSTKAEMIINGILPIDKMLQCMPPIALLTSMLPGHVFETTYGVMLSADKAKGYTSAEELLNAYGYMRGFMTQRGIPDAARSSRIILKDFVNGKLLYCQAPPGDDQESYHPFIPPSTSKSSHSHVTPAQQKLFSEGKVSSRDLEDIFFRKVNLGAHKKGVVETSSKETEGDKPWRKHHNRNKKEKLRRVYACHDN